MLDSRQNRECRRIKIGKVEWLNVSILWPDVRERSALPCPEEPWLQLVVATESHFDSR